MRILHVSSLWPPAALGGAELYAARLASEQAARGDDVAAITLGAAGDHVVATVPPWPYRLDEFHHQPAWRRAAFHGRDAYDALSGRVVRRTIESFAPDVVHTHAVTGMSAAVLTAPNALRRAHVHTLHDYWLLCERTALVAADGTRCDPAARCAGCRVFSASREVVLRRHFADIVVAPSESIASVHEALWPWLTARVRVIRHPADAPPAGSDRPARAGPVTFGYLGHLSAAKGVGTLLSAFARWADGEARLEIAGLGALEADVRAATASGAVAYSGWVEGDRREAFFARVDCLIAPSEVPESAGLAVAEARQRGVAVIASDIGALPEYVDDASRSLLVPPGDTDALVAAMRAFAADPDRYRPTGAPPDRWPHHLEAIDAAYAEAQAVRRSRLA